MPDPLSCFQFSSWLTHYACTSSIPFSAWKPVLLASLASIHQPQRQKMGKDANFFLAAPLWLMFENHVDGDTLTRHPPITERLSAHLSYYIQLPHMVCMVWWLPPLWKHQLLILFPMAFPQYHDTWSQLRLKSYMSEQRYFTARHRLICGLWAEGACNYSRIWSNFHWWK